MKYTRLIYMSGIVLMLLSACSDSSSLDAEGQNGKPLQQTFTVAVESVGGRRGESGYCRITPSYFERYTYADIRQAQYTDCGVSEPGKGGI